MKGDDERGAAIDTANGKEGQDRLPRDRLPRDEIETLPQSDQNLPELTSIRLLVDIRAFNTRTANFNQ